MKRQWHIINLETSWAISSLEGARFLLFWVTFHVSWDKSRSQTTIIIYKNDTIGHKTQPLIHFWNYIRSIPHCFMGLSCVDLDALQVLFLCSAYYYGGSQFSVRWHTCQCQSFSGVWWTDFGFVIIIEIFFDLTRVSESEMDKHNNQQDGRRRRRSWVVRSVFD